MLDDMGFERKIVLYCFAFLFITFISTGLLMENSVSMTKYGIGKESFNGDLPIGYSQLSSASTAPSKLRAEVKGSIYETGSNMTVFGACFDGNAYLLPDANATFTAWYPNGTIVTGPNATMDKIYDDFQGYHPNGTGRWKIHVTMGSTIGTYLTEMRCEYQGEYAVAFGEWQNPEWVKKIGDSYSTLNSTYLLLQNMSANLTVFENTTNNNFNTVINALSGLSTGNADQIIELQNALAALDSARWVLDETNPFFVLGSNVHNYTAVDMLAKNSVAAVSSDGYFDMWDGETWTEFSQPTIAFKGVSILPSNTVYAWGVGSQSGVAVYSINGANASTVACGSPTGYNDVRLYQTPNTPSAAFKAYLLGNDGSVCFSNDGGNTWSLLTTISAGSDGRISQVVENYGVTGQPNGYATLVGQGNQVMFDNGVSQTTYNVTGTVKDVSLKYTNLGYVVAEGVSSSYIYKFNGTGLVLDYTINDSAIVPTAVHVEDSNNVWVSTVDPSVLYHYDGHSWEYAGFGVSQLVSVVISFGNMTGGYGLHDVVMSDGRSGYAVGNDGLILVLQTESKQQYDQIIAQLNLLNQSIYAVNGSLTTTMLDVNSSLAYLISNLNVSINTSNLALQSSMTAYYLNLTTQIDAINSSINTQINLTETNILSYLSAMNASLSLDLSNIYSFLNAMNASLEYKLDNVLTNVTYTNLYLTTTLFPMVNATYQNTLQILIDLGIIQGQLNQTIQLQNNTLQIVNATDQKVDQLLNKSNRIKAWVTQ